MNLLLDGLLLMLVGMGTVFVFLAVMVGWIELSSKILARLGHWLPIEAPTPPARKKALPKPESVSEDEHTLVAVIASAVQKYRSEHRK